MKSYCLNTDFIVFQRVTLVSKDILSNDPISRQNTSGVRNASLAPRRVLRLLVLVPRIWWWLCPRPSPFSWAVLGKPYPATNVHMYLLFHRGRPATLYLKDRLQCCFALGYELGVVLRKRAEPVFAPRPLPPPSISRESPSTIRSNALSISRKDVRNNHFHGTFFPACRAAED